MLSPLETSVSVVFVWHIGLPAQFLKSRHKPLLMLYNWDCQRSTSHCKVSFQGNIFYPEEPYFSNDWGHFACILLAAMNELPPVIPVTWNFEITEFQFEASLSSLGRLCFKMENKPGIVIVLVSFPVPVLKYSEQSSFREKGLILAHSPRA